MIKIDKALREKTDALFRQARISVIKTHPWWGALGLRLAPEYTTALGGKKLDISATDGRKLFINPHEFANRNINERRYIVFHELLHPALGHLWRKKDRDNDIWNIATDIHIHNLAEGEGFQVLADVDQKINDGLRAIGFSRGRKHFVGQTAEQTYEEIFKRIPPQQKATFLATVGMAGQCGCCQSQQPDGEGEGADKVSDSQLEREWKAAVLDTAMRAGNQSAIFQQIIEARISWSDYLHEFLQRGLAGDFSWLPVNRRFIHAGMYFPSTQEIEVGEIAMIVDTSGSMSEHELAVAFGEIAEFRRMYGCVVHLIECDAGVANYTLYERGDDLPDKFPAHGRGGTSFDPPFEFMREHGIEPRLAVYFTDGCGDCSAPAPTFPVLWAQIPWKHYGGKHYESFRPPWGEHIKVEVNE